MLFVPVRSGRSFLPKRKKGCNTSSSSPKIYEYCFSRTALNLPIFVLHICQYQLLWRMIFHSVRFNALWRGLRGALSGYDYIRNTSYRDPNFGSMDMQSTFILFFYPSLLLSSPSSWEVLPLTNFWTSRGQRCLPFSPPVRAFTICRA